MKLSKDIKFITGSVLAMSSPLWLLLRGVIGDLFCISLTVLTFSIGIYLSLANM